jgi:hypothetical protein
MVDAAETELARVWTKIEAIRKKHASMPKHAALPGPAAASEVRKVHDPFQGRDIEISDRLTDRLRGKYACGPAMPDGEPEFGWRQFEAPAIQHEAATALDLLQAELAALEKARDEWKAEYFRRHEDAANNMCRALTAEVSLERARDALHQISDLQTRKFDQPVDLLIKAVETARPFAEGFGLQSRDGTNGRSSARRCDLGLRHVSASA